MVDGVWCRDHITETLVAFRVWKLVGGAMLVVYPCIDITVSRASISCKRLSGNESSRGSHPSGVQVFEPEMGHQLWNSLVLAR
jgi:hypothetical protein